MIFPNNIYLIISAFFIFNALQYYRYHRIAGKDFRISGLLLLKMLIRSLLLILFILLSKTFFKYDDYQTSSKTDARFVIKTNNPNNFKLTDDDRVNILTRIPNNTIHQIQLLLFNPRNKTYYVYIPSTSVKTFNHLLAIDRKIGMLQTYDAGDLSTLNNSKQRIELFELKEHRWILSQSNQNNFSLFKFLDEENDLISPYLLHYLLILILCFLAIDLGIKYRILKI